MPEVHNKKTRSYNMSRIRSKDTKPEILVRKFLFIRGFRYRLHNKRLPGKPDIVFPKYKTAVLIHGCFWHGHNNCPYFVIPKTRRQWWVSKINRNKTLDIKNTRKLRAMGWRVITVFECKLKPRTRENTLNQLSIKLTK